MFQGLDRVSDGLLVAEVDLNLCRQVRDHWGFRVSRSRLIYDNSQAHIEGKCPSASTVK